MKNNTILTVFFILGAIFLCTTTIAKPISGGDYEKSLSEVPCELLTNDNSKEYWDSILAVPYKGLFGQFVLHFSDKNSKAWNSAISELQAAKQKRIDECKYYLQKKYMYDNNKVDTQIK